MTHGPGRAGRRGACLLAVLASGCVASVVDGDPGRIPAVALQSVVIPTGERGRPEAQALREFYEGLLVRLHAAYTESDVATMRQLLAGYRRDDAPDWAQDRLSGFAALATGLAIEQHLAANAQLELAGTDAATDEIGAPRLYELVLPPMPGQPLSFGGRDDADPTAFGVAVAVHDDFVDGSQQTHDVNDVLRLPAAAALAETPLRLPVLIDLGDAGAVRRQLEVRVDLLPGYIAAGQQRAPVRRTRLASARCVLWPRGHDAIRRKPLETLRAALQLGDPAHFPHVRLGAEFAPAAARPEVERRLIDWVRLGRPDQALVAMATLRALGAADLPVGDRERWLAWWQGRR